jgi:2-keto-3-deoxy-L-rhamnonate aldolase RhmA
MNNDKDPASRWKNPSRIESVTAERLAASLTEGTRLRKKVASGWALGTFLIELPAPSALGGLALAGFDFVVLDMEHSAIGFSSLDTLITAGHAAGIATLVRTWGQDPGLIGKVLDMGANGVMAAHVDTPERARDIVDQARFRPLGNRGFSPITRFDSLEHPIAELDEATYVIVQIEGRDALAGVRDIAAVPGIDAIFVGPYDLALSMDVSPGSEAVYRAAEQVASEVPEHRALGIYVDDPARCADWAGRRFALQCVSFDGRMLTEGARSVVERARGSMLTRPGLAKPQ